MQFPAEIVRGDGSGGHWFLTDRVTKQWVRNRSHAALLIQTGKVKVQAGTGDMAPASLEKIVPYTWPQSALDSIRLVGPTP